MRTLLGLILGLIVTMWGCTTTSNFQEYKVGAHLTFESPSEYKVKWYDDGDFGEWVQFSGNADKHFEDLEYGSTLTFKIEAEGMPVEYNVVDPYTGIVMEQGMVSAYGQEVVDVKIGEVKAMPATDSRGNGEKIYYDTVREPYPKVAMKVVPKQHISQVTKDGVPFLQWFSGNYQLYLPHWTNPSYWSMVGKYRRDRRAFIDEYKSTGVIPCDNGVEVQLQRLWRERHKWYIPNVRAYADTEYVWLTIHGHDEKPVRRSAQLLRAFYDRQRSAVYRWGVPISYYFNLPLRLNY